MNENDMATPLRGRARESSNVAGERAPASFTRPMRQTPPRRTPNRARRSREYLTPGEVEQLIHATRVRGRYGARDAVMILIAYRHGLRVAELVSLRWDQVNFVDGLLRVNRINAVSAAVHPLFAPELRALRPLRRETESAYVFMTERGAPMTPAGFRKMLARTGRAAALVLPVHPQMLRHACARKLAGDKRDPRAIQEYLGRRDTKHGTGNAIDRFREFWND